jgi:hypothetical protein
MSKIDNLLNSLEGVRKGANGNYMCKCPAHEDRLASLTIKEADDGRILLNCFAGCGALEILNALGMNWDALYPDTKDTLKSVKQRISPRAAAEQLSLESKIIFNYAKMINAGQNPDTGRLLESIAKIDKIKELLGAY